MPPRPPTGHRDEKRKAIQQVRYVTALCGGLALAFAFPKIDLPWLAWLGHGLILISTIGLSGRKMFRLGYCAGLGQFLLPFYWLLLIPLPLRAIAAWLAFCGFLALFTAAWSWIAWRLFPANFSQSKSPATDWKLWDFFLSASSAQRIVWAATCAAAWVAMEMVMARILTGLPYSVGVSQFRILPLIQIASVTGVYGVSFLIVWVSVAFGCVAIGAFRRPRAYRAWMLEAALPLAAVAGVLGFGVHQLSQPEPAGPYLKVALVQPSIPQTVIWDPNEKTNRFNKLVALSEEALAYPCDLLVWPESALPNLITRFNPLAHYAITNLVLKHHVWMILGANDARPKTRSGLESRLQPVRDPRDTDVFISSFLIDPAGQLVAKYHKRHLVAFGEYMPLARWLPFLNKLRASPGGFTPGDGPVPFHLTEPRAKIGVLICSEDVFPHLVREYVDPETDFLLNLTNDGWFGHSAVQWHHAIDALFRAVENGLPLVRCTNDGLTCWIDSRGRLHDIYFPSTRDIYRAGFKQVRIPLLAPGQSRSPTFYHRYGDSFGWTCVGWTVLALLLQLRHAVRKRRK